MCVDTCICADTVISLYATTCSYCLVLFISVSPALCVWGGGIHVICAAAVFLTCSQQHVVDVLAVASLGTCSASAAAAAA